MRYIAVFALLAAPANAQAYSDRATVRLFTDRPCTEAISVIDAPFPEPDEYDINNWARDATKHMAQQSQAWGFILGYDTANGGLASAGKTTLERLRMSCAEDTGATALDILNSLEKVGALSDRRPSSEDPPMHFQ